MKRIIVSFFLIIFIFGGCNKQNNNVTTSIDKIPKDGMFLYSVDHIFENLKNIYLAEIHEEGFYTYASLKDHPEEIKLYFCNIKNNSIDELTYEKDKNASILSISAANDEVLWILEYNNAENTYKINILEGNSSTLFEHKKIKDSSPFKIIADCKNKYLYIHSINLQDNSEYIYVFNFNGEQLANVKCDHSVTNIVYSEKEEELFLIENNKNDIYISRLDQNNFSINRIIKIESSSDGYLYNSSTQSANMYVKSILMSFDLSTKSFTPIFDVLANGLSGNVKFILPYGEEFILIRGEASNDTVVKLSKTSDLQKNKETITLATLRSEYLIETAVSNFNSRNSNYNIEIIDYSVYGDEALKKLNTEIISGDIPDIFDLNGLPVKKYISNGLLENLNSYMKRDLDLEEFWSSALLALYVDDGCYTVVPGFQINAVFGTRENIDEINSLDFNDTLHYIKDKSNTSKNAFGNNMTQLEFIEFTFLNNMDNFINYKTKECNFTSDEFVALLETAKELAPYEEGYDEAFEIYSGSQCISFQQIRNFADLDFLAAIYRDNFAMTNLSNNNSGFQMIPLFTLGMSSQSEFKEVAWNFLKMFYSEEFLQFMNVGFPMSKAHFEIQWDTFEKSIELDEEYNSVGFTYYGSENGVQKTTVFEFSKKRSECYKNAVDLINHIDRFYQVDTIIMEIISDEFQAYLYNDKLASEVAANIQDRVHIYLNE